MRREPGLGTTSFSIISDARRMQGCLTCISAIGSRGRSACSTRSATVRSNGSDRPDGGVSPLLSRPLSSKPCPPLGVTMPFVSKAEARTGRLADSGSTSWPRLRRRLVALAASTSIICSPVAAQDAEALPTLEELIPDEAVADPEGWAAQGVPADAASQEAAPELDASSPLDELSDVDLPWPEHEELPQIAPPQPEEDTQFPHFGVVAPRVGRGDEGGIADELALGSPRGRALFPCQEEFPDRFEALSPGEGLDDAGNAARLA